MADVSRELGQLLGSVGAAGFAAVVHAAETCMDRIDDALSRNAWGWGRRRAERVRREIRAAKPESVSAETWFQLVQGGRAWRVSP